MCRGKQAGRRVPEMRLTEMQRALSRGVDVFFREEERGLSIAAEERGRQHPWVFYRRELKAQPQTVARPGMSPSVK